MAVNFQISSAAQNAACDALVDLLDAGTSAGKIKIYDGSQPSDANTAVSTQNVLATFTLADPAFGAASSGVATLDADPDLSVTASATGTAAWFRAEDSDGNVVFDGSVGTSSADLVINTTSITSGNTVKITAGTVTMPAN